MSRGAPARPGSSQQTEGALPGPFEGRSSGWPRAWPWRAKRLKAAGKLLAKARTKDSTQALGKLTSEVDGRRQIISDPPMIVPIEEIFSDVQADMIYELLRAVLGKYRRGTGSSLPRSRR